MSTRAATATLVRCEGILSDGRVVEVVPELEGARNTSRPAARATLTNPSSGGCRSASSAGRWDSASASSSRMPRCASVQGCSPSGGTGDVGEEHGRGDGVGFRLACGGATSASTGSCGFSTRGASCGSLRSVAVSFWMSSENVAHGAHRRRWAWSSVVSTTDSSPSGARAARARARSQVAVMMAVVRSSGLLLIVRGYLFPLSLVARAHATGLDLNFAHNTAAKVAVESEHEAILTCLSLQSKATIRYEARVEVRGRPHRAQGTDRPPVKLKHSPASQ